MSKDIPSNEHELAREHRDWLINNLARAQTQEDRLESALQEARTSLSPIELRTVFEEAQIQSIAQIQDISHLPVIDRLAYSHNVVIDYQRPALAQSIEEAMVRWYQRGDTGAEQDMKWYVAQHQIVIPFSDVLRHAMIDAIAGGMKYAANRLVKKYAKEVSAIDPHDSDIGPAFAVGLKATLAAGNAEGANRLVHLAERVGCAVDIADQGVSPCIHTGLLHCFQKMGGGIGYVDLAEKMLKFMKKHHVSVDLNSPDLTDACITAVQKTQKSRMPQELRLFTGEASMLAMFKKYGIVIDPIGNQS